MLHEFISANRDELVRAAMARMGRRPSPLVQPVVLGHGAAMFLEQLAETLRLRGSEAPFAGDAIGISAAKHGGDLLNAGFNLSQVVHDYGDICQAVTQLAFERREEISVEEFNVLNGCLDTAIAEAVTEYARLTAITRSADEVERLGRTAHDLRDLVSTARLAFHVLKQGTVPVSGSTSAVLGRSLMSLQVVIDRVLSEVRLDAGTKRREPVSVREVFDEAMTSGRLHAEYRRVEFVVHPVDPGLAVLGDLQLISAALMNLIQNAFKYTPPHGRVLLRARAEGPSLLVEIEDQCGGFPDSKGDIFQAFGNRLGADRSGLGLGLSIARKAIRAHGGDITHRNIPGQGCVFIVQIPLHTELIGA